ncbi:hypothetical protein [Streptomyces sioyaensis]|uniref:hypothetical protein n=1 Tax=Streptomyces sioyaensis TaxID=67364 RepID=UPI003713BDC8
MPTATPWPRNVHRSTDGRVRGAVARLRPDPHPIPGTTVLELTDPTQAASAIGKAATRALATTEP